ncbi:MAG: hypothetical protein CM1200mP14_00100 [Gammaproteobacteria bacterium]|nr:MAG: hypothetical protein CM1200mP14_00100 [Gammaproteobacteria bacterium]
MTRRINRDLGLRYLYQREASSGCLRSKTEVAMEKYSKLIRIWIVITALVLNVFGMLTACTTDSQPQDDSKMNAEEIRSFAISVPDEVLTDLNDRLERTRFPDQIPGTGWDYGMNREYLKELIEYWKDEFDWRDQEEKLNSFDHFKTAIDG